jgi:hypothetical protein
MVMVLAACTTEDEVAEQQAGIYVIDGRCPASALSLYKAANYQGEHLCLGGSGVYWFPADWAGQVRSFRAGTMGGTFYHPAPVNYSYCAGQNQATVNTTVAGAWAVGRNSVPVCILDGGP